MSTRDQRVILGHGAAGHRRDSQFHHFCAEIVREAVDERTLDRTWQRLLHADELRSDPELAAMLRSFLEQKRAEIREHARIAAASLGARPSTGSRLPTGVRIPRRTAAGGNAKDAWEDVHPVLPEHRPHVDAQPARLHPAPAPPTREQLVLARRRDRAEFDEAVGRFDVRAAEMALDRLSELHHRPGTPAADVEEDARSARRLDALRTRVAHFAGHVDRLAAFAAEALRRGDADVAARFLQRLSSIHAARPALLPQERLDEIRAMLARVGEDEEARAAAAALVARERSVVDELKRLIRTIHRFHDLVRAHPPDSEEFRAAERAYREALGEIRAHDNEWLAGLILELEGLIEELHDPTGHAIHELDHFLDAVRAALRHLASEVRAIQRERESGAEPGAR
ncbi:MAG: hypothetical protein IPM64_03890 [Phycisphaerales bacterium]|nr:hypothetical protein [Phycisphaerales bacterium]